MDLIWFYHYNDHAEAAIKKQQLVLVPIKFFPEGLNF